MDRDEAPRSLQAALLTPANSAGSLQPEPDDEVAGGHIQDHAVKANFKDRDLTSDQRHSDIDQGLKSHSKDSEIAHRTVNLFFKLPPELRNVIYHYFASTPDITFGKTQDLTSDTAKDLPYFGGPSDPFAWKASGRHQDSSGTIYQLQFLPAMPPRFCPQFDEEYKEVQKQYKSSTTMVWDDFSAVLDPRKYSLPHSLERKPDARIISLLVTCKYCRVGQKHTRCRYGHDWVTEQMSRTDCTHARVYVFSAIERRSWSEECRIQAARGEHVLSNINIYQYETWRPRVQRKSNIEVYRNTTKFVPESMEHLEKGFVLWAKWTRKNEWVEAKVD